MNRTIKFRAWDASKNKMREVTSINWYDEYLWVDETPLSGDRLLISVTPIMQFAGLIDKNGKEYFEGDILDNKEVVEFRDGCFFAGGTPLAISASHREIIGNKFENPELLS